MHKIGYTTGVFDLFHIGHLNLLTNIKQHCHHLVVGVSTDALTYNLKKKMPIIPFEERLEIVRSIRVVDEVVPETADDKLQAWEKIKFDAIFKGSDWQGSPKWQQLEGVFADVGVKVVYLPYTETTSSTLIRHLIDKGAPLP